MERESAANRHLMAWLGGIALGAAAMYLADPAYGRRRRAVGRDKARSLANQTQNAFSLALRDAGNRWRGMRHQALRMMRGEQTKPLDDHVLEARVRSRLGRKVSHPHSVRVSADKGRITLSGPIMADEHATLLLLVQAIPGVQDVKDRLEIYEDPSHVSGLQGEGRRSPGNGGSARAAMAGLTLLGCYGIVRRSPLTAVLAFSGAGLLTVGRQVWRSSAHIHLQKSVEIKADPEFVFNMWSRYENFPLFMSNVVEVRDLGDQRSHWTVKGPAGVKVEWNAVLTRSKRPESIEWRSEPGSTVDHAGAVSFEPSEQGTLVTVRLDYRPPAGAFGHAAAALLHRDPRSEMEQDLQRMKQFIESGKLPRDAGRNQAQAGLLH